MNEKCQGYLANKSEFTLVFYKYIKGTYVSMKRGPFFPNHSLFTRFINDSINNHGPLYLLR